MSSIPAARMATQHPAHMRVFDVGGRARCRADGVFADCTAGLFDGFRLDTEGRIWTSAGDGIHCYDPDGTLIGKVKVPEVVANCVFGGPQAQRALYLRHDLALRGAADGQRTETVLAARPVIGTSEQ